MILFAKNELGSIPVLNPDLLDIENFYTVNGDIFLIAVNADNRIIGSVGTLTCSPGDIWLKRLYIKPLYKRCGIGRALVGEVEKFAHERNVLQLHTRFNKNYKEAALFYPAIGFIDAGMNDNLRHMIKKV